MDIFLVVLLVILNGIFAMSEMSLVSAKKVRLQQMADKGNRGAKAALQLQSDPTRMLSSVQVGITCIGLLSGMIGEKALIEPLAALMISWEVPVSLAKTSSMFIVVFVLAFMSVVLGEIVPKRIGLVLAERVASILATPMTWLSIIALPIVFIFTKSSEMMLKILKLDQTPSQAANDEEIEEMMSEGSKVGNFDTDEMLMVSNVLKLDRKKVTSIMTRHIDFVCVDIQKSLEENIQIISEAEFSKVVVIDGNVNNIIGYLPVLKTMHLIKQQAPIDFVELAEKPLFLPETLTTMQVLRNFRQAQKGFGIVVDEHGENIGLVTISDIFSAMIGEITPDAEEEPEIVSRGENSWFIDGSTALDDVEEYLNLEKLSTSGSVYTMAGFILEKAECIPSAGFKFKMNHGNFEIEIEVADMDGNTIDKVILTRNEIVNVEPYASN